MLLIQIERWRENEIGEQGQRIRVEGGTGKIKWWKLERSFDKRTGIKLRWHQNHPWACRQFERENYDGLKLKSIWFYDSTRLKYIHILFAWFQEKQALWTKMNGL